MGLLKGLYYVIFKDLHIHNVCSNLITAGVVFSLEPEPKKLVFLYFLLTLHKNEWRDVFRLWIKDYRPNTFSKDWPIPNRNEGTTNIFKEVIRIFYQLKDQKMKNTGE